MTWRTSMLLENFSMKQVFQNPKIYFSTSWIRPALAYAGYTLPMPYSNNRHPLRPRPKNKSVGRSAYPHKCEQVGKQKSPKSNDCKTRRLPCPQWHECQCPVFRRSISPPKKVRNAGSPSIQRSIPNKFSPDEVLFHHPKS